MKKILLLSAALSVASVAFARDFTYESLSYTVLDENSKTVATAAGLNVNSPGNKLSGDVVVPEKVFDGDVEYTVVEVGTYSFVKSGFYNGGITSITLPSTVVKIGKAAFQALQVESMPLPDGILEIGEMAFYNCANLDGINFPEGLQAIGKNAFYGCRALESVKLPSSLSTMASSVFYNCSGIKHAELGNGLQELSDYTFSGCSGLTELVLGNGVKTIGGSALSGCSSLKELNLPASLNAIKTSAFQKCTGLESLVIPASVTEIANGAFASCSAIIEVEEGNPSYVSDGNGALLNKAGTELLYLPASVAHYDVPEGVVSLPANLCTGSALESIGFPSSLKNVGNTCFYSCKQLSEVKFSEGLETIGTWAFAGCPLLKEAVLPSTVTSVGASSFANCTSLETVVIPSGITALAAKTFNGSTSIKSVTYEAADPVAFDSAVFADAVYASAKLYINAEAAESIKTTAPWNLFQNVEVLGASAVEGLGVEDGLVEIFTLSGAKVAGKVDGLGAGLYIMKRGNKVSKIVVR